MYAEFCELLSIKLIRLFAADDVELVQTLVREWDGFQGVGPSLYPIFSRGSSQRSPGLS